MNPGEDVDAPPGIHGNHLLRPEAEAERDLELLAQRHEVAILSRQVKRPELLPAGRFLRAALGRRLPVGRLVFTPATILRWHQGTGPSPLLCFRTSTSPWSAADPRELRSLIVHDHPLAAAAQRRPRLPPSGGHRHRQVNHASDGVAADWPADRGVSLVLFGIGARHGQF